VSMIRALGTVTLVAILLSNAAWAASIQGSTSVFGFFTSDPRPFSLGDDLNYFGVSASGQTGDYLRTGRTSPFNLVTSTGAANNGTFFTFEDALLAGGPVFTFTITETTTASISLDTLSVVGRGTVDDGAFGFDPTISSFRFTYAGISNAFGGGAGATLAIVTPPAAIPLPAGAPLIIGALVSLAWLRRRRGV